MTILLLCPWCDEPLELAGGELPDLTRCDGCGTLLDLAPDPPPVRTVRPPAPLPEAA